MKKLKFKKSRANLGKWDSIVRKVKAPLKKAEIAVVGKYVEVADAYKSIKEALIHAGIVNNARVNIRWVDSERFEKGEKPVVVLKGVGGILVPGGFGMRGIEGKIAAIKYARENKVPFFGICLGMQSAVIEFARNVLKMKNANSTEFDKETKYPVIALLEAQKEVKDMGASMRLGAYPCRVKAGTNAAAAYKEKIIFERHRHRYEFNNCYREDFEKAGMVFSGLSPDNVLVETVEIKKHPWFTAVQFHPEFKSKPSACHPLFREFVRKSL